MQNESTKKTSAFKVTWSCEVESESAAVACIKARKAFLGMGNGKEVLTYTVTDMSTGEIQEA